MVLFKIDFVIKLSSKEVILRFLLLTTYRSIVQTLINPQ